MNLTETIQEKINRYEDLLDVAKKLDYVGVEGFRITTVLNDILIKVSSLKELTNIRHILRQAFLGKWNDKLDTIWVSSNMAIASYENKDVPEIIIWLETTIANFPEELMKNGCHFKKAKCTESEYHYVCDTGGSK